MPPITRLLIREYGDLSPRGQLGQGRVAMPQEAGEVLSGFTPEDRQANIHSYSNEAANRTPAPGSILDILA